MTRITIAHAALLGLLAVACDQTTTAPTPAAPDAPAAVAAAGADAATRAPAGLELPDDFPEQVLLPEGGTVISAAPAGAPGRWELGMWIAVDGGVEVVADLIRRLEAEGWVVEAPAGTELMAGYRMVARRDDQSYRLLVVKDPEGPNAVVSISLAL